MNRVIVIISTPTYLNENLFSVLAIYGLTLPSSGLLVGNIKHQGIKYRLEQFIFKPFRYNN